MIIMNIKGLNNYKSTNKLFRIKKWGRHKLSHEHFVLNSHKGKKVRYL